MKYEHCNHRDFKSGAVRKIGRREARKILAKIYPVPEHELDRLKSGQVQVLDLAGWGWLRTVKRERINGMTNLRNRWRQEAKEVAIFELSNAASRLWNRGEEEKAEAYREVAKRIGRL